MSARRYSSEVRAEQRRASRERVIEAARAMLLHRGYTGATVEAIAARAGVSVQTVYNTVGGKAAVLKAVYDTTLAGDDEPVPIMERPTALAMRAAPDARTFLALYARMGRELYERAGPMLAVMLADGGTGDPDVGRFLETIDQERATGTRNVAAVLHERFELPAGLTVGHTADVLWALTAPELAIRLVHRRGWSLDRYEAWLAGLLAGTLLGPGRIGPGLVGPGHVGPVTPP